MERGERGGYCGAAEVCGAGEEKAHAAGGGRREAAWVVVVVQAAADADGCGCQRLHVRKK